jgi:hypothetical protein
MTQKFAASTVRVQLDIRSGASLSTTSWASFTFCYFLRFRSSVQPKFYVKSQVRSETFTCDCCNDLTVKKLSLLPLPDTASYWRIWHAWLTTRRRRRTKNTERVPSSIKHARNPRSGVAASVWRLLSACLLFRHTVPLRAIREGTLVVIS